MIFVRDKGRMCNNILQYGHLYAWARANNRKTVSMRFAYKYQYFHICRTRWHNFFVYLFAKYAAQLKLIPTVTFDTPDEDLTEKENAMMHGCLVAEGWFARWYDLFLQYKPEILSLFAFDSHIENKVTSLLEVSSKEGIIRLGVHIRRGDYATWNDGRFLYDDKQMINIIRQFILLHPNKRVVIYICGNDSKLNKQAYSEAFGQENVVFPQGNPGEDLCLLSHCDYLIGPPSTFTLVASMYRNTPLYWIKDINKPLQEDSFDYFDNLFRNII